MEISKQSQKRLKCFKVPEDFKIGDTLVCPNCQKKQLRDYLDACVYSGIAHVGDLVCTNCNIIISEVKK